MPKRTSSLLFTALFLLTLSAPAAVIAEVITWTPEERRAWDYKTAEGRIEYIRSGRAIPGHHLDLILDSLVRLPPEIANLKIQSLSLGTHHRRDENGAPVQDISLLRGLRTLQVLDITNTPVSSLAALKDLVILQELNAIGTRVTSLDGLQGKQHLDTVRLDGTNISSLRELKDSPKIRRLSLSGTRVQDLSPLMNMADLEYLNLSNTPVSDLSPLRNLKKLKSLFLSETSVIDLSPLRNLTELTELYLAGTDVMDLTALARLQLRQINISGTKVTDLRSLINMGRVLDGGVGIGVLVASALPELDLESLGKMNGLANLVISDNRVKDWSFLKAHTLRRLDVSGTEFADLTLLEHMKGRLRELNLSRTLVVDLSPLSQHKSFSRLRIDDMAVKDISPLAELPNLSWLHMRNTKVADLEPLRDKPGLKLEGAEMPTSIQHPEHEYICAAFGAGRSINARKQLADKMGGLAAYYRVVSGIECGVMRNSPLYEMAELHIFSTDFSETIREIASLDDELRLALLNKKNHRRTRGRNQPETLLDRVDVAHQVFAKETSPSRQFKEFNALRERLIQLGAKRIADAP